MPSAAEEVRRAIAFGDGAIRFDEFVRLALYGDHGFYTGARSGRAGRRGDFLTSPEVGPLFGTVIARAFDAWWEDLGRPDPFDVVEVGAGPGTLARAVVASAPACASVMRYTAVEIAPQQRAMHPSDITSLAKMPDQPLTGVIVANELLDNLPFRLFVFDGGWRESYVGTQGDRFVEHLAAVDQVPSCLPNIATHGARAAVQDAAREWVESAISRLVHGRVVALDYCTNTATMVARPWREWLRTYASHGRGSHYLANVGDQDITVEVAVDQLPAVSVISTQADFLRRHGIASLVEEGRHAWLERASSPDLAAMRMRSRVSEAKALLDPNGLGSFSVLEWATRDSV